MTLTEFLLARIAEDEALARSAAGRTSAEGDEPWRLSEEWEDIDGYTGYVVVDPARVLAECEAKRNLIGLATDRLFDRTYSSEILGILALPYADHPDYRDEWRP